jgi:predicted permease
VLAVSVAFAPAAWADFFGVVGGRAGSEGGALVAVPFWVRFAVGLLLAGLGGWLARPSGAGARAGWTRDGRLGEVVLVVGLTIANPTLWATALSLLVAVVPLLRTPPRPMTRAVSGG